MDVMLIFTLSMGLQQKLFYLKLLILYTFCWKRMEASFPFDMSTTWCIWHLRLWMDGFLSISMPPWSKLHCLSSERQMCCLVKRSYMRWKWFSCGYNCYRWVSFFEDWKMWVQYSFNLWNILPRKNSCKLFMDPFRQETKMFSLFNPVRSLNPHTHSNLFNRHF